ncbi:MAG: PAC2 family protein [Candidatus Hadarchaeales archaeon]
MLLVKRIDRRNFRAPLLIAGFPGIANVGRVSAEFLIQELKAKPFMEIYSSYLPEWVLREGSGISAFKIRLYRTKAKGKNLILATSDAQAISPFGQYKLSDQLLDAVKDYGVNTVITMAAYVLPPHERKKGVFAAATNPAAFKKFWEKGAVALDGGMIVGMNGLLIGLAGLRGWEGICLMGATHGGLLDLEASSHILRLLSEVYELNLKVENLERYVTGLPDLRAPSGLEPTSEESPYI